MTCSRNKSGNIKKTDKYWKQSELKVLRNVVGKQKYIE